MPTTDDPKVEEAAPQAPGGVSAPEEAKPSVADNAWQNLRSLLLVVVAVFFFRAFIAEATVIPTGSMERTILIGDHLFLNKLLYGPRIPFTDLRLPALRQIHRGDIVAFRYPRNPSVMFVKRVIGEGGDVVRIVDKQVYLNGRKLKEPYDTFQDGAELPLRDDFPPSRGEIQTLPAAWGLDPTWAHQMPQYLTPEGLRVPEDCLFVMGDNRDNSLDSRFWGFVPIENVVGEPLFVYWSYDAPTRDWTAESWSGRLKFDGSIVLNFFKRTRWSRTGKAF